MKSLVLGLLVLLALPAAGLEPYLVHDINPVPSPENSDPESLSRLGGAVLFFAGDQDRGRELWRSDGTAAGTWPLSDICDPEDFCYGEPLPFLLTERLYFFLAPSAPFSRYSLWVSDGTPAGTFPLTDPEVDAHPPIRMWAASQGVLYFVAEDPEHGTELWRSDGTPAGTWLVADVRPGPEGSYPAWMREHRGRIWFGADDGQRGGSLWSTDGTPGGTVLALDPVPSSASHPAPELIRVVGNRLTFVASTPGGGQQLWAGDGTAKRTAPITKLAGTRKRPSRLHDSVLRGNRLYFVAEDRNGQELWVSDGTARGTRPLTSFAKGDPFFGLGEAYLLFLSSGGSLGDRFVFKAHDGAHGIELWITDGTAKGTRLLRDVCPGACSSAAVLWQELNGRLYFPAWDGVHGYELWSTDGTEAGTRLALDLCPGTCGSSPFARFLLGGRLLFAAVAGEAGQELWSTDGTAAGTVQVSDFAANAITHTRLEGEILGNQLLFAALDPLYGNELWRTDGTPAGTQLVKDVNASDRGGSFVAGLHALGDSAVFFADDGIHGHELWRSHGPGPGASLIRDLIPGEEPRSVPFVPDRLEAEEAGGELFFLLQGLCRTDGTEAGTLRLLGPEAEACCLRAAGASVFFLANAESAGKALWTSDGTVAGTRMLEPIPSFNPTVGSRDLIVFQGKLHFIANSPAELWVSDGTEAGTAPVKSFGDRYFTPSSLLTVHAGRLWFFAQDDEHGAELWSSDGTAAGTALAVELAPGPTPFVPHLLESIGTALIVTGSAGGPGIWATDGTPEGTRRISSNLRRRSPSAAVFQGRLFLGLEDFPEDYATGLWVTDGTEAGTMQLLDRDGQAIPTPEAFAALGDRLLFVAGESLYQSDGTEAGTFRLRNRVLPDLVRAGDRAFFSGFDDATGWELWAVRP